jgi:PAS domain S-box-containing protein
MHSGLFADVAFATPFQQIVGQDRGNVLAPPKDKSIRKIDTVSLCTEGKSQLACASPAAATSRSADELLHELQVHRIELEMQNEELRRAQVVIVECCDRYVELYEFAPVGYLTLSREGMINEINLIGAALLGEERNRLIQRRFSPFVVSGDSDAWQQHFMRTKQNREKQSCELQLKRGDGSVFLARLESLHLEAGNVSTVRIVISDITEQKRMEREILARRNEMTELHMLHVAAQTAAAIAHELNQPLLSIASYSEAALMLMKTGKPDLEKIFKAIDGCERQAQRAGQTMRELLESLSIGEFSSESFDLNNEILDVLEAAKSEHELQFNSVLRNAEELPLVRANRIHLKKVLFNLLHNAVEAMREARVPQPSIIVTVSTKPDDNVAQVTIQDNGPGVKKDDMQRLFDPFFTTKVKGIGMGLAVSRSLIEENGGQLWIDTQDCNQLWLDPQDRAGAIFHLTLPFAS